MKFEGPWCGFFLFLWEGENKEFGFLFPLFADLDIHPELWQTTCPEPRYFDCGTRN